MVYFCPHLLILSGIPYSTLCNKLIEELYYIYKVEKKQTRVLISRKWAAQNQEIDLA